MSDEEKSQEDFIQLDQIDLTKLKDTMWQPLVDAKIITNEGIRICGQGIVIKKLEKLDRMAMLLSFIDKKLGGMESNKIDNIARLLSRQTPK